MNLGGEAARRRDNVGQASSLSFPGVCRLTFESSVSVARTTDRQDACLTLPRYANKPIAGLPLLPTLIGRPLGVITSCSIGSPAAHPIVAWKLPTVIGLSSGS